jgi:hypothetical protein
VRRNATVNLGLLHISLERKRYIAVTYRYIFLLPKAISFFVMGTASMVEGRDNVQSPQLLAVAKAFRFVSKDCYGFDGCNARSRYINLSWL